jgi:hypothetical protein
MPRNHNHIAGTVVSYEAGMRAAANVAPAFRFEASDDLASVGFGLRHDPQ